MKRLSSALIAIAFVLFANGCVSRQRTLTPIDQPSAPPPAKAETPAPPPPSPQTDVYTEPVALPPMGFATISKTDSAYVTALGAHDLDKAQLLLDKTGAFKGIVTGIHEPSGGKLRILNFDADYSSALTAVVWSDDASKFPDINELVGKEVLVSGTFTDYRGRAQIILKSPDQIKLVQ